MDKEEKQEIRLFIVVVIVIAICFVILFTSEGGTWTNSENMWDKIWSILE